MGLYLMFGTYNTPAVDQISPDRTREAAAIIERNGGTLKGGYAMLGEKDILLLAELPDTAAAVKASLTMSKRFGISFNSSPALELEAFDNLDA